VAGKWTLHCAPETSFSGQEAPETVPAMDIAGVARSYVRCVQRPGSDLSGSFQREVEVLRAAYVDVLDQGMA
jgi:hypothetical protein